VCKQLAKTNAAALKDLEKKRNARAFGQLDVASAAGSGLSQLQALEALPENTTRQIAAKEAVYHAFWSRPKPVAWRMLPICWWGLSAAQAPGQACYSDHRHALPHLAR
jgi:hypothetical protein